MTSIAQQHPENASVIELDVREDLRNGNEPFTKIMAAVGTLTPSDVLHLRATFEPVPLFRVMGKRGFLHAAEAHADDDWSVWFWRSDVVWLEVRGMEPPDPLVQTLAALESLPDGHTLVQVNERVPQFLLPILAERGFVHEIDDSRADCVLVRIWRQVANHSTETSEMTAPTIELDVRAIPPRDKHPSIFRAFDGLSSGESLMLVNDHDPKPLRYQLMAERPDHFEWDYVDEGPDVWRVRISRR